MVHPPPRSAGEQQTGSVVGIWVEFTICFLIFAAVFVVPCVGVPLVVIILAVFGIRWRIARSAYWSVAVSARSISWASLEPLWALSRALRNSATASSSFPWCLRVMPRL
jgi:uncharacterized membrane protein